MDEMAMEVSRILIDFAQQNLRFRELRFLSPLFSVILCYSPLFSVILNYSPLFFVILRYFHYSMLFSVILVILRYSPLFLIIFSYS